VVRGREDGARYWAETCPQYLLFSRDLLARADGALFTFTPTMKEASDSEALWSGLANGEVTYVGSDHSPFASAIKLGARTFEDVYPGIPGTETLLPLLFSHGVNGGRLELERLAEVSSTTTARVFQLIGKGAIRPGNDADLVIVDPHKEVVLSREVLHSRCDYTPYEGIKLLGYPVATISRGEVVVRDGAFIGRPGRGRFVERAPSAGERVAIPA
jgi:dihydropyrimidinase